MLEIDLVSNTGLTVSRIHPLTDWGQFLGFKPRTSEFKPAYLPLPDGTLAPLTGAVSGADVETLQRGVQIAVNTCVYLESAVPHHLPRKKGVGVGDVFAEGPDRWEVGRELCLSTELRLAAGDPGSRASFRVRHRFVVRGHWRNQAVGPQRSLRERMWIKPHLKGPEGSEPLQRTYAVD